MKRIFLLLVNLTLFQNYLFAENTIDPQLKGVWRGTIGKQEVMVCFDDDESSYYYLKYFWGIPLVPSNENEWEERGRNWATEDSTGQWKFNSVSKQSLKGEWTDPKGERAEKINLKQVSPQKEETLGCWSPDSPLNKMYNLPRANAQKTSYGEIKNFNGRRYRELSTLTTGENAYLRSIELLEEGQGVSAVNKLIHNDLTKNILPFFGCQTSSIHWIHLDRKPGDVSYSYKVNIKFLNSRWLSVIVKSQRYCGGAHPNGEDDYRTFDLEKGVEVDIFKQWIKKDFMENLRSVFTGILDDSGNREDSKANCSLLEENYKKISQNTLRKLGRRTKEFCKIFNYITETFFYTGPFLSPEGLSFCSGGRTYAGIAPGCSEKNPEFNMEMTTIPYLDLLPFLTDEGKAAVKSIMSEVEKK